jgi:Lon protease-like protein
MAPPRDARGRFRKKEATDPPPAQDETARAGRSDDFLTELQASWEQHGAATIDKVRNDRPHDYLRLMASSLPKPAAGKADAIEAMSDDEIADELRHILDQLAAARADPGAGA